MDVKSGVFMIQGMQVECSDLDSCLIHRMEILNAGYKSSISSRPSEPPSMLVVRTGEEGSGTNESGSESDIPR